MQRLLSISVTIQASSYRLCSCGPLVFHNSWKLLCSSLLGVNRFVLAVSRLAIKVLLLLLDWSGPRWYPFGAIGCATGSQGHGREKLLFGKEPPLVNEWCWMNEELRRDRFWDLGHKVLQLTSRLGTWLTIRHRIHCHGA